MGHVFTYAFLTKGGEKEENKCQPEVNDSYKLGRSLGILIKNAIFWHRSLDSLTFHKKNHGNTEMTFQESSEL